MKFFKRGNPIRSVRPAGWFAEALLLSLFWMMPGTAYADGGSPPPDWIREVRIGLAAHDVDGLWSGSSVEAGPDIIGEIWFNRELFHLFSANAYPNAGVSINTRGDTSRLYGGCILQWAARPFFLFATGLGLALHNGERSTQAADQKSLGSGLLFRIPVEIGIAINRHHRIILAFDHMSNADLTFPNEGMDTLGILYAYRF